MGGKSNFLEKALLDHVFGRTLYVPPETMYLAIYTTGVLTDASTGADPGALEVGTVGTAYTRLALPNTVEVWAPADPGTERTLKVNVQSYEYRPAESDWGTITQWALLDSALVGEGNILYFGVLPRYRDIFTGDILTVGAGQIRISED